MSKQIFCVILFLQFVNFSLISQIDSTEVEELQLIVDKGDESSIEAAKKLRRYYSSKGQKLKAENYAHKLVSIGKKIPDINAELYGLRALMISKYTKNKIDSVLIYTNLITEISKNNESEEASSYSGYANHYKGKVYLYNIGDFKKAYHSFILAIKNAEDAENGKLYSDIIFDFSNMYYSQEKTEKMIALIDEALVKLKDFKGRQPKKTDILYLELMKASAIGEISTDSTERKKALAVYQKLLRINKSKKDIIGIVGTTTDMIDFFKEDLTIDSCLYYANEIYPIVKENPRTINAIDFIIVYIDLLNKKKDFKKAFEIFDFLNKEVLIEEDVLWNKSDLIEQKIITYKGLEKYEDALNAYDEYVVLKDSLFQKNKENEIENIETNYALDKKEAENAVLQSENQMIQSRSKLLSLIGLLLVGMLILGFYFYHKIRKNNRQLQRINDSKNQLFAILAHDLKGPARAFNNLSNKLSFLIKKNDSKRLLEVAEHFEKTGNQVNYMMDNLLNWAISQKDEFSHVPQRIDIHKQLESISKELEYILSSKNIKIENKIAENVNCLFDPNAFKVVMRNLLHNAIKFSRIDSTIILEVNERQNILKIIDSGIGMPPELIEDIITEKPLESRIGTAEEKGNGIGLSTCIKLIHKNESKIKFESSEEKGTTVILEMKPIK